MLQLAVGSKAAHFDASPPSSCLPFVQFANLIAIQRKVGRENFPLIEQTYFPTNKEISYVPKFPCVVKIGQSHNGLGKIKVDNLPQYQDIRSVLLVSKDYCTIEPFIEAKCDLLVQKIGTNYKAFT